MAFLLDDILLAPLKGIKWVTEKLRDVAEAELFDEDKIQEELMTLQAKLDMGEITEEDYRKVEETLIKRINEVQKRKEEIE